MVRYTYTISVYTPKLTADLERSLIIDSGLGPPPPTQKLMSSNFLSPALGGNTAKLNDCGHSVMTACELYAQTLSAVFITQLGHTTLMRVFSHTYNYC